jgi:hypothetical protein
MAARFKSLLREPLSWFFGLAVVIFTAYSVWGPGKVTIAVTRDVRAALAKDFELLNGRTPNENELSGLLDKYVADEVLFRAALEHGLQLNDPKMKQRMIDKMRFLMTDPVNEPSQEELVNFYADNLKLYYTDRKLTFEQVFYEGAPADSAAIVQRLRAGEVIEGDRFWLGRQLDVYGETTLRNMLGARFIEAVRSAPLNQWVGPIQSPRGVHFVRLQAVIEPEPIPYDQVREQVEERWFARRRSDSVKVKVEELKKAYDVKVES